MLLNSLSFLEISGFVFYQWLLQNHFLILFSRLNSPLLCMSYLLLKIFLEFYPSLLSHIFIESPILFVFSKNKRRIFFIILSASIALLILFYLIFSNFVYIIFVNFFKLLPHYHFVLLVTRFINKCPC